MSHYTNPVFWVNALDRMVSTFAQALIAALGAEATGIIDAQWKAALSIAAMAAILSLLTSVASPDRVETGTAVEAYRPKHAKEGGDE